jgi:hypothetical protein
VVTARKQFRLLAALLAENGADGVDHLLCLAYAVSSGSFGLPCRASVQASALLEEFWTGGTVNRTIHAASSEKRAVGRIDNCLDQPLRDIALYNSHQLALHTRSDCMLPTLATAMQDCITNRFALKR